MVKKIIIGLFVAVVIMGCASKPPAQPMARAVWTETAALNSAKEWADATSKPDAAALEKILAMEYIHVHATGLVENKQQFIDALKTGARKYDPIILEETNVRIFGATAIVNARFNLKAVSGDRTIEGVNRITLVFVYSSHGVQAVSFQATPIPAAAGK
jgi:hypothetical protein